MARKFKHFAEKVKGCTLQALIENPDNEGFGNVKEWQIVREGEIVHRNTTNHKARRWLIDSSKSAQ